MKIAIPIFRGRISPVFDYATSFLVVEVADGAEASREYITVDTENFQARTGAMISQGVEVVICGAISRRLEMSLSSTGLRVIPNRCGNVEQIIKAYISGQLEKQTFFMPGGLPGRRRFRGGRGQGRFSVPRNF